MKIAMIGAGSHVFARRLIADILSFPALEAAEIALMDLDAERLTTMKALADRMVQQGAKPARITATTDLPTALQGADYVTVSIRSSDSRHHITIPERYGINQAVGDTSGPGGVFYYLKNVQAMVDIAQTMERLCPDALMLNYTNPMVVLSWTITDLTDILRRPLPFGTGPADAGGLHRRALRSCPTGRRASTMAWFLEFKRRGRMPTPHLRGHAQTRGLSARYRQVRDTQALWRLCRNRQCTCPVLALLSAHARLIARQSHGAWSTTSAPGPLAAPGTPRRARCAAPRDGLWRRTHRDGPLTVLHSHHQRIETSVPYMFNGNVPNTQLITNLPPRAVVEVIVADGCGLHPAMWATCPRRWPVSTAATSMSRRWPCRAMRSMTVRASTARCSSTR